MESHLSDFAVASGGAACVNAVSHEVRILGGWNVGEPSSSLSSQNQMNDDGMEMEHGRSTSCGAHTRVGVPEERQLEPTTTLFPGRHIGHNCDQDRSGPSFLQGSSSSHAPQNLNLNAGYVGNTGNVGTSSGSSCFTVEENNDDAGLSLGGWDLSCKRKALEGTSVQYCSGGSSSFCQPAENHTSACYDASSSLSLSPPSRNSLGVGITAVEDSGNTENCPRSFGRISNPRHQQEFVPFNMSSRWSSGNLNIASPHPSPTPLPFGNCLELRSTSAVGANTNEAQNLPHAVHVSTFSRNVHRFPWSGASSPRIGDLSNSFTSGDRGAALQEAGNSRSIPTNNSEHYMFVPSDEMRNMVHDPTSWGLATGSSSGGVYSTAQIRSNSSNHPLPTSAGIPPHNHTTHSQQRLLESPWSLFPSAPQNSNLNAGYVGNGGSAGQGIGTDFGRNPCNSSGLQSEQASLVSTASDKVGTSSGSSGFMAEKNYGDAGSSLRGWGLSCKRKALEGTSAGTCSAGSSSCFPPAENVVSARNDPSSSLSLSLPLRDSHSAFPPDQPNPRFEVGMRVVEDGFSSSGVHGNSENRPRSYGRRENPRHQQELPINLSSRGSSRRPAIVSSHSSAVPLPFSDSLELRSEAAADVIANTNAPQIQPHSVQVSAFSRNVHRFPWRGASSSRASSLSISSTPGERGALREEGNGRGIPRNNAGLPMFVSSADMRNMVHNPSNWGVVARSSSGAVSSTTRIGSSSSIHPLPGSAWIPHPIPSTHSHRLMSEIRQVLTAMRRGENLRIEDFMLFEPLVYHGLAEMHDRHRDMRLDVDNMSYEELLALEERIGDVSTGLSEETIMKIMKQKKHVSLETESPTDMEPCCICQEEYADGDDLGTLDCGHNFHTDCIKPWLTQKNLCPICKTTALAT